LKPRITEIDQYKDTLLLKLFFSASRAKRLLAQLRLQHSLHQKLVVQYQTETAQIIAQSVELPHTYARMPVWEATRRFGELAEEAYLRWLDETIPKSSKFSLEEKA